MCPCSVVLQASTTKQASASIFTFPTISTSASRTSRSHSPSNDCTSAPNFPGHPLQNLVVRELRLASSCTGLQASSTFQGSSISLCTLQEPALTLLSTRTSTTVRDENTTLSTRTTSYSACLNHHSTYCEQRYHPHVEGKAPVFGDAHDGGAARRICAWLVSKRKTRARVPSSRSSGGSTRVRLQRTWRCLRRSEGWPTFRAGHAVGGRSEDPALRSFRSGGQGGAAMRGNGICGKLGRRWRWNVPQCMREDNVGVAHIAPSAARAPSAPDASTHAPRATPTRGMRRREGSQVETKFALCHLPPLLHRPPHSRRWQDCTSSKGNASASTVNGKQAAHRKPNGFCRLRRQAHHPRYTLAPPLLAVVSGDSIRVAPAAAGNKWTSTRRQRAQGVRG